MTTTKGTEMNPIRHDDQCLAHAMVCAIENLRDSENPMWNLSTHAEKVAEIARDYLATGTCSCYCADQVNLNRYR